MPLIKVDLLVAALKARIEQAKSYNDLMPVERELRDLPLTIDFGWLRIELAARSFVLADR